MASSVFIEPETLSKALIKAKKKKKRTVVKREIKKSIGFHHEYYFPSCYQALDKSLNVQNMIGLEISLTSSLRSVDCLLTDCFTSQPSDEFKTVRLLNHQNVGVGREDSKHGTISAVLEFCLLKFISLFPKLIVEEQ